MITSASNTTANYLRSPSAFTPKMAAGDSAPADTNPPQDRQGVSVSDLIQLNPGPMIHADQATLDRWAAGWLSSTDSAAASTVSDDAPQNTYAQVKVDGRIVATLYNGGSATMTNDAAATIGDLQDPQGLSGPNLAQWRAEAYAKALGGTVEKADTAISQSEWTPRPNANSGYTRAQLDEGLAGYFAANQKLSAARYESWQPSSGTDMTA